MATPQENLQRFQEIANRGLQDNLDPDKRARFDEAMKRGLIQVRQQSSSAPTFQGSAGGGIPAPPAEDITTRATRELPELFNSGLLQGEDPAQIAKFTAIAAVTPDEQELAKVATSLFSNIGVQQDEKGNVLLGNNRTGARAVINKPGITGIDAAQLAGLGAAFSPAGRAGGIARGVLAGAGTQAGIEGLQTAAGGDFNAEQVAAAGALQPLSQAVGAVSGISRVSKAAPSAEQQALLKIGRETGIPVLTSDISPPDSIIGGLARQFGERVPFFGTSGVRASQQKAREKFAKAFAESVPPVNDRAIIQSLNEKRDLIKSAAGERYQRITQQMDALGEAPAAKTLQSIDEAIAELSKPGIVKDAKVISDLKELKGVLSQPQTFSLLKENRTYISDLINSADPLGRSQLPTKTKAMLTRIRSSLTQDMDEFVKSNDARAFEKYKQADRIYANEAQKLTKSRLKNVLDKGDVTPEQFRNLMFSNKTSEQELLYQSLTNQGRANARIAVLDDIVQKAGGENLTPQTLSNALKKRESQINVFFRNNERTQLKGFQRLLEATRRAQDAKAITPTGQALQTGGAITLGAGAAASTILQPAALTALFFSGSAGVGARIYESKPVRDLLMKLANTPKRSAAELAVLKDLSSVLTSATEAAQQVSSSSDVRS